MNKDTDGNTFRRDRSGVAREWVGGRLASPFYIMEDDPYRPEMDLCLELPEGIVVGFEILDPAQPRRSFAETLEKTMESPIEGPSRRPARVRVADEQLAADIREAMPDMVVDVAPTPELDEIIKHMKANLPETDPADMSYFEGGLIPSDAIKFLFETAKLLYEVAPWGYVFESDLFRVDIPELGVEGACLIVMGNLEGNPGFLIFPSYGGYQNFLNRAKEGIPRSSGPVELGTEFLSLNYERGAELPESMRKEAARHRWPVAGPEAYPLVSKLDSDGMHSPITENDIQFVAHCALSLTSFFAKHGDFSEIEVIEPICESYFDENDLEVKLTFPYP